MQRKDWIVDTALAAIVLAIVVGLFVRLGIGRPEKVIATTSVLGVKAELLDLRRIRSDMVEVKLRTTQPGGSVPEREFGMLTLTSPRADDAESMHGDSSDSGNLIYTWVAHFREPSGARRVSLAYKVTVPNSTRYAVFDFSDVAPQALPIRRTIGETQVTLRSLNLDKEVGTEWEPWYLRDSFSSAQAYFGVEVDVQCAGGVPERSRTELIDAQGSHQLVAECFHQTALRKVESDGTGWGVDRALQGHSSSCSIWPGNGRRMYLFDPLGQRPKRFTFRLTLKVPPSKADQGAIEFRNVLVR